MPGRMRNTPAWRPPRSHDGDSMDNWGWYRGGQEEAPKKSRANHKADAIKLRAELASVQAILANCREVLVWPDGAKPTEAVSDLAEEIRLVIAEWRAALDANKSGSTR